MAYPDIDEENFLQKLVSHKEIYSLRADPKRNYREPPDELYDPFMDKYLKIHSHQLLARNLMGPNSKLMRMHLKHSTGTGKCHGKGTKVMLAMGASKNVEDLVVGDVLMGDDGYGRRIESLARGVDVMWEVVLENGDGSFVCNEGHVITVVDGDKRVRDMCLSDWRTAAGCGDKMFYSSFKTTEKKRAEILDTVVRRGVLEANASFACRRAGIVAWQGRDGVVVFGSGEGWAGPGGVWITPVGFTLRKLGLAEYYGFTLSGNNGRYLLGNFIVTHNTLATVCIAQEHIYRFREKYDYLAGKIEGGHKSYVELDRETPSVFVLGFGGTKAAFSNELLKYPEFGFVSVDEKFELLKRQKAAMTGVEDDVKFFKEYFAHLRKRITNKSKGGFYKFYGYDEFVNRLFSSDKVKLTQLEHMALNQAKEGEADLETIIRDHIKRGLIYVNRELMAMLEGSLMVCDEIHNTYNTHMKNNRGVAVQFVLDTVKTMRFVSLSATPINNSPTECVELVNYLVPADKKITKKEFFSDPRTLVEGKLEELGRLVRDRISFLQDSNIKYFPARVMMGEDVILPEKIGNFEKGECVPYLKFVCCKMSPFHQATFEKYVEDSKKGKNETEVVTEEEDEYVDVSSSAHPIPADGYCIYDIAFPNPESDSFGLFKSSDVRNKLFSARADWKTKKGVDIKKYSAGGSIVSGDFLRVENVGFYSAKYRKLVEVLIGIIKSAAGNVEKCQKVMVYHSRVRISGVLLIQELLNFNGFIDETREVGESTICCVCGEKYGDHAAVVGHDYRPARFIVAHSSIDKAVMDNSLARYNSSDNSRGLNYMVLVGSRIIKESYDFKDIRSLLVVSLPVNIPTLIQVFGRCIRKKSHMNLPPADRKVDIYMLISVVDEGERYSDKVSPELHRYVDKLSDYRTIQKIEREFDKNAIDANVHRNIIMSEGVLSRYFPSGKGPPVDMLGMLYFEPSRKVEDVAAADVEMGTFVAYEYYEEEIKNICYIIKRLFLWRRVWTYDELWGAVREPPVGVEVNPKFFSEDNFVIALNKLVGYQPKIVDAARGVEINDYILSERMFNVNDTYIYFDDGMYKVVQVGQMYATFPVVDVVVDSVNDVVVRHTEHVRDKEQIMIKELLEPKNNLVVDADVFLGVGGSAEKGRLFLSVEAYIKSTNMGSRYESAREKFLNEEKHEGFYDDFLVDYTADFQMKFLEEAIQAKSKQKTTLQEHDDVIGLFGDYGAVIFAKEIKKYKDVAAQFKNGVDILDDDLPVGYTNEKLVRLFDGGLGLWIKINKISLNRQIIYKENDIVIGYLETATDGMKFKLRKPAHKTKAIMKSTSTNVGKSGYSVKINDIRLIEKGIVCSTKTKAELLYLASELGLKSDRGTINELCGMIKRELIKRELNERGKKSKYKYFYSWWDEPVSLVGG